MTVLWIACVLYWNERRTNETHGKMQTSILAGESGWTMRETQKGEERTRDWENSNDYHLEQPVNASDNKRGIWLRYNRYKKSRRDRCH